MQPTTTPPAIPETSPNLPSAQHSVQQNYLTRQVLKAQDRIQEHFPFSSSLDAVFWINGAVAICKHCNVRDEKTIAEVLSSELWNYTIIQAPIDAHLTHHSQEQSACSVRRLIRFCLKEASIYTKPTSVITSALSRYQKPSDMDVQEHLTAHLQKERDLLLRRDSAISDEAMQSSLYGSTAADGTHVTGSCEDSAISRVLDSLRPTEPFLMEHLDKLELLQSFLGWTLTSLIKAIQLHERKLNESTHFVPSRTDSALVSHHKAKIKYRQRSQLFHNYNFYDPTTYTSIVTPDTHNSDEEPVQKKLRQDFGENQSQNLLPSFISSMERLSTVTEALHKMYDKSPSATSLQPPLQQQAISPTQPSSLPPGVSTSYPRRSRTPTHCMRCGSNTHLIWECTEENDDKADDLREQNAKSCGFHPNPRFKERGKSFAHTWAFRERLWPKAWLKPPKSYQETA